MENKIIEVSEIVDSLKSALAQVEAENKLLAERSLGAEALIDKQKTAIANLQEENAQLKLRELDRLRHRKGQADNFTRLSAFEDPLDRVNLADYHRLEQDYKSLVEENDKLRQVSVSCNRDVKSLERHVRPAHPEQRAAGAQLCPAFRRQQKELDPAEPARLHPDGSNPRKRRLRAGPALPAGGAGPPARRQHLRPGPVDQHHDIPLEVQAQP